MHAKDSKMQNKAEQREDKVARKRDFNKAKTNARSKRNEVFVLNDKAINLHQVTQFSLLSIFST